MTHTSARMATFGQRVRAARAAKGWSLARLAAESRVSKRTIGYVEGGRNFNSATAELLAAALGLDAEGFLTPERDFPRQGELNADTPGLEFFVRDFRRGRVEVGLRAEVACGEPMDHSVVGETVLVPADYAPDKERGEFLVRARGESMVEFGIGDGWYVVVEPREGGVAATGDLILAWYEPEGGPGGVTLKYWERKGGRKILVGSTPETTFELKDGDGFKLIGIVRSAFPPPILFARNRRIVE